MIRAKLKERFAPSTGSNQAAESPESTDTLEQTAEVEATPEEEAQEDSDEQLSVNYLCI